MEYASLSPFYLSTHTSPSWRSPETDYFYSTRSGPLQQTCADKTKYDEFEFKFAEQEENEYRLPARANSFSTIAFADELFCNGHVLPLKPPPRLQSSVPTSPSRSFSSRVRKPFAQQCTWNDGFDPFMIALEKVSEETELVRLSVHRRSRSYSPFRASNISLRVNCTIDSNQGEEQEATIIGMVERKGSMYSKWVRSQTVVKKRSEWSMQQYGQHPTARTMIKRLCLGRIEPVKPVKPNEPTSSRESKMQKIKTVLLRYASLKKDTSESKQTREIMAITKVSYFKQLRHSVKANLRRKKPTEPKMTIVYMN